MAKNYCTISIDKTKSTEQLQSKFSHNHRKHTVPNADPDKITENRILINVEEKTYQELYNDAIKTDYYRKGGRKIRSDAVKGFEIITSFSHAAEENIDIDDWIHDNIEFVSQHFGGYQNIKDAVLHADETTIHMHFFVVPIASDGRLCAKEFINGRKDMVHLHDEYGKAMSKHGLIRGNKGSCAKHSDIRLFYSELNDALYSELPAPDENEPVDRYYKRADKYHKKAMLKAFQDKKAAEDKITQKAANSISKYSIFDEFAEKAKKKFGSVKKAITKLFDEFFYLDLGLQYAQKYKPELYADTINPIIEGLIQSGKDYEPVMNKNEKTTDDRVK